MLETTANGKPYIRNGHISWNASHTKDWAVLAVTSAGAAIGCDVERLDRQLRAPEALARRLGLTHSTDVVGVDESLSRRVLRAWSEREAVAKALGTGLGRMPNLSPISTAFQVVVVPVVAGQVLATVAWTPPRTVKRIEMFALETLTATEWARLALDQHAVMDMSSDPTSSAGIH
jgi:phosphopantetheinyl transferase